MNGNKASGLLKAKLDNILKKGSDIEVMSIGAAADFDTLTQPNSTFKGLMKQFIILPSELSAQQIQQYFSSRDKESFTKSLVFNLKAHIKTTNLKSIEKEIKNSGEDRKFTVSSQGVSLLEKFQFEELVYSVGDITIFLMAIPMLADSRKLDNIHSFGILCEILNVLKLRVRSNYSSNIARFFGNYGFYILSNLISEVTLFSDIKYHIRCFGL